MIKINDLKDLEEEYLNTIKDLEKSLKGIKKELKSYYNQGIYISKEIWNLRKKIVIYEDMLYSTKATYHQIKNYYRFSERND